MGRMSGGFRDFRFWTKFCERPSVSSKIGAWLSSGPFMRLRSKLASAMEKQKVRAFKTPEIDRLSQCSVVHEALILSF